MKRSMYHDITFWPFLPKNYQMTQNNALYSNKQNVPCALLAPCLCSVEDGAGAGGEVAAGGGAGGGWWQGEARQCLRDWSVVTFHSHCL